MRAILWVLLLCGPVLGAGHARQPAFELRALGVLGGDVDTNLSSYLLAVPGGTPRVLIDGGSMIAGILRWKEQSGELAPDATWTAKTTAAIEVLKPVEAALFTHAHLDHVGGFIQRSTLDIMLAMRGKKSLAVMGLPVTIDSLKGFAFRPPLWVDFSKIPPDNPALRFQPMPPGAEHAVGPFQVKAIPVNHPDGGAAFLIRSGDHHYLHCGDTGRCAPLWASVRPVFEAKKLRAITLEVSWPGEHEKLATQTGHLTTASWLLELNELAQAVRTPPPAEGMTRAQMQKLARALAPYFRDCPLIVTHIKAMEYDKAVEELKALQEMGLNLIIPEQGKLYKF
jgi:cAMP phosphodiesterase